jgi:RND family efflux transporter MFP subunit
MPRARLRSLLITILTSVVALIVVLAAMLWLSGAFRGGRIEPGAPVRSGVAARPATQPLTVQIQTRPHLADIVGSIQAENRTQIAARLLANIVEMRVSAGDRVQAGDVVAVLDDRDLRARVAQASETLKSAEARRDLAAIELTRVTDMVARNVASEFELDRVRSVNAGAVADVARFQQAVAEAQVALSDTQIRSPISGIVIDRLAEPGDQASPGKPLLTVYDPARLRVQASARESYVGRLHVGQELTVFIDVLDQERMGVVQEIVPQADPSSRSFDVKVRLEDSRNLLPGMFARLRLPLDPRPQVEIPVSAVRAVGQVQLVQVLDEEKGHVNRRAVRLGQVEGDRVAVLAGLAEGEQILPWTD